MKLINSTLSYFIAGMIFIVLFSGILAGNSSCKIIQTNIKDTLKTDPTFVKRISWNILFNEKVNYKEKIKAIENIKDSVRNFYGLYSKIHHAQFLPRFDSVSWCPCDSTLFNLNFGFTDTSGISATSAPKERAIRPQGEILGKVLSISENIPISDPHKSDYKVTSVQNPVLRLRNITTDPTKILAIIDSGIDTTLFDAPIQNLIWKSPSGRTLFNFIPFESVSDLSDRGAFTHGSAVTALAIKGMQEAKSYPRIMILKVVNANDHGTIYSLGCALSYAIQNHATLVNVSLGYLGDESPVLRKYMELANADKENPVQLFFAAGNTPNMSNSEVCSDRNNNNQLGGSQLFYPACFSDRFKNITTVTQIRSANSPCIYQYYSDVYVSLGVLTKDCCFFRVDFKNSAFLYQGSSFATPVASGIKMATIINTGERGLTNSSWNGLIRTSTSVVKITRDGKYITH